MKLFYSIVLMAMLIIPGNMYSLGSDNIIIKPVNAKTSIVTIVSGTNRTYYPLSGKNSTLINLKGPGQLKIVSRARLNPLSSIPEFYQLYYRIDGGKKKLISFQNVLKSKNAVYKKDSFGVPGEDGETILKLGGGEHNIKIWLGSDSLKIDARYIFTPQEVKKINWVSLCPLNPNEPVNLVTDEEEIKYYRFSESQPVKLIITGPTRLRILTRIENQYRMKGMINYRLQVKEDNKVKHSYQLSSKISETTTYKNDDSMIPGKAKEIIIDVPEGTHHYEIIPMDKDKKTLLGRILFPKKDIKLEAREQ